MAEPLLSNTTLNAVFVAGRTALGNHWDLFDGEGNPAGTTRRSYAGNVAVGALRRIGTAMDFDNKEDDRAEVLDADGEVVARIYSSKKGKQTPRVEIADAAGEPIGTAERVDGEGFTYMDAAGKPLARIPIADKKAPGPWEVADAHRAPLGRLSLEPTMTVKNDTTGDLIDLFNTVTLSSGSWKHTGFNFSGKYCVALAGLPDSEPLRTLAVLTPVIAGYSY